MELLAFNSPLQLSKVFRSNEVLLCMKQKVAKSVDNSKNQKFGDLWPSNCLLRAATAVSRQSKH